MFRAELQIILTLALLQAGGVFFSGILHSSPKPEDSSELPSILKIVENYCEKIMQYSLHYVCREEIINTEVAYWVDRNRGSRTYTYNLRKRERKQFLYDYQLIRKSGRIFEKRNLLEENGKKKEVQDVSLKGIKYVGKFQVFGPVGFFSREWQKFFDYRLEGKENLFGKKCLVLSAVPKHGMKFNQNTARIWVDENGRHILKIDWEPSSIQGYDEEPLRGEMGEMRKKVTWSTEFQFENTGIRFPSRQTIREYYIDRKNNQLLRNEIIFQYSDYRFFIVEVDVTIKDDTNRGQIPPPRT